jgi:hypothetical protein
MFCLRKHNKKLPIDDSLFYQAMRHTKIISDTQWMKNILLHDYLFIVFLALLQQPAKLPILVSPTNPAETIVKTRYRTKERPKHRNLFFQLSQITTGGSAENQGYQYRFSLEERPFSFAAIKQTGSKEPKTNYCYSSRGIRFSFIHHIPHWQTCPRRSRQRPLGSHQISFHAMLSLLWQHHRYFHIPGTPAIGNVMHQRYITQ